MGLLTKFVVAANTAIVKATAIHPEVTVDTIGTSITNTFDNVMKLVQKVATPVAAAVLAISGFMLLFSIGEKDQLKMAKSIFISVLGALLIIYFASPIVKLMVSFMPA